MKTSEMTFLATYLSLCGKDKHFETHKNIKQPKSVGNFHVCNYSLSYLVPTKYLSYLPWHVDIKQ